MFVAPLSPEEEYWCGYFRADGYLYVRDPTYCRLVFAQKEREPVEAFSSFFGATSKIQVIDRSTNYGPSVMYRCTTTKHASKLKELGVKGELNPILYQSRHFWRGLLDGDGSVMLSVVKERWTPVIAWSGNHKDMTELSSWVAQTLDCDPPRVFSVRSIFAVAIKGRKARYLGSLLYQGQYACLGYKRERALTFKDWKPGRATYGWDRHYTEG